MKKHLLFVMDFFGKIPFLSGEPQRNPEKSVAEKPKLWYNLCCVIIGFFENTAYDQDKNKSYDPLAKSGFQQDFNCVFR